MKNKFFILLCAGLLMASCNEDVTLNGPLSEEAIIADDGIKVNALKNNPNLNGKAVTRPMKVKGDGYIEYNPSACSETQFLVEIHGKGTATHMGKFDLYLSYCRNFVPGEHGESPKGYQVAANGDILYTEMGPKDEFTPVEGVDEGGYYQYYLYTGGTGRFTDAQGWIKLYFNFDPLPPNPPTTYTNFGGGELTF